MRCNVGYKHLILALLKKYLKNPSVYRMSAALKVFMVFSLFWYCQVRQIRGASVSNSCLNYPSGGNAGHSYFLTNNEVNKCS